MVPKTWTSVRLSQTGKVVTGSTPSTGRDDYWGGEIPFVTPGDMNGVVTIRKAARSVTPTGAEAGRLLPPGSVLFTSIGIIGKVALTETPCITNQQINAIIPGNMVNARFLYYALLRLGGRIQHLAGNTTLPIVTKSEFASLRVLLPPRPEQDAIAYLLSSWDRAIIKIGDLASAKTEMKHALAQQLLTGKERLPGFSGSWGTHRLGDLFRERRETARGDLPLLSITNDRGVIPREQVDRKDSSNPDKTSYRRIAPGDIGYNTMRMWQGVSALSELEGIVSPAYTICTTQKGIDGRFAAHLFKLPKVVHLFYRYSQGLVDDTLQLRYGSFAKIKVTIPGLDEQCKIAAVLAEADREINLLRRELELLRKQKRGLMQKLLTGQIRVKT